MIVYLGLAATGLEQVAGLLPEHVLAGEHLLGAEPLGVADADRLRPDAVPALTAALAGATGVRLLLPVRRQDRLMEHAHLAEVRRGGSTPFAEQFPNPKDPVLDWAELAERLSGVPGVERVEVLPLDPDLDLGHGAWVDALSELVGPAEGLFDRPPTYSARGIRVARAMNGHLETDAERALVREFVAATFPGPSGPDLFLSAATRARVVEAYRSANRRLFRDWLPGYPETAWDQT
ncbi:MAG: hypothetical protein ACT4QF_13640 [Sporichthyaceae bacterium]